MINLQPKVAPSHIGANHLLCFMRSGGSNDSIKPSESKKNENNAKDRPFINRPQHNQQFPFQKKKTVTEDFIFSHFHANYCTGGKPIQKGLCWKETAFFFSRPKFRIQRVKYLAY